MSTSAYRRHNFENKTPADVEVGTGADPKSTNNLKPKQIYAEKNQD